MQRARPALLIAGLFEKSEALLKAIQSLRPALLAVVDRSELGQRIAKLRPVSDSFRNPDREPRDSHRLGVIAFQNERVSQRSQLGEEGAVHQLFLLCQQPLLLFL